MSFFDSLNPTAPVASRFQAARAAEGSAGVWLLIAVLFGFGTVGTLASRGGAAGLPAWTIFLGLTIAAAGVAAFVNRRKSVSMAVVTLIAAVVMSILAVGDFLGGKGLMAFVPPLLLALAVRGYRGARALRAFNADSGSSDLQPAQ